MLDIPFRVAFTFPVGNDVSVFAFGGPNFNIGLSQKLKTVVSAGSLVSTTTTDIYNLDSNDDNKKDYSRFDLQLGVGAGLKFQKLQVRVGYDWGMFDLNMQDNVTLKRNELKVSLGYML